MSQVGFTVSRGTDERRIALIHRERTLRAHAAASENGHISIEGRLFFANAIVAGKNRIGVVDDDGKIHQFVVPEGMMADIVKPLWEDRVEVYGVKRIRGIPMLERIVKAPGTID